jgi:membrane protease YdiL (CAAX protease family)
MFLILQVGATWLAGLFDLTWAALIVTALMLLTAAVFERLVFNLTLPQAFRVLGFGPPTARAMLAAALIACIMLLFFPVFSFITEVPIRLQPNWPWILVGAIALNGVAEETLFRGFVFGGLRRSGLSFGPAGTISMAIFAAVHLLLFVQSPFIIALLSTLLALAAAFPMAYLFERGGNIVWAPALLHVAAHTIRLVDIPEPYFLPAVASWSVMQLSIPFLVFAFRKRLLTLPR